MDEEDGARRHRNEFLVTVRSRDLWPNVSSEPFQTAAGLGRNQALGLLNTYLVDAIVQVEINATGASVAEVIDALLGLREIGRVVGDNVLGACPHADALL